MSTNEIDKNDNFLTDALKNLDETTEYTQDIRRTLINKFLDPVLNMDMTQDAKQDAEEYEAYNAMINTVRQLLNDVDTTTARHVNVKLKKIDLDQQRENNFDIAQLLASIKLTDTKWIQTNNKEKINYDDIENRLEEKFNELEDDILETELELGGSNLPKKEDEEEN